MTIDSAISDIADIRLGEKHCTIVERPTTSAPAMLRSVSCPVDSVRYLLNAHLQPESATVPLTFLPRNLSRVPEPPCVSSAASAVSPSSTPVVAQKGAPTTREAKHSSGYSSCTYDIRRQRSTLTELVSPNRTFRAFGYRLKTTPAT